MKTEAQQHYEEALRIKIEAEDFLSKQRCFDCPHLFKLQNNKCRYHGQIPDEYLYEINECPTFICDDDIPF